MDDTRPKPQPPVKKEASKAKGKRKPSVKINKDVNVAKAKPEFVLREHLTERPFKNHKALAELKKSLNPDLGKK